MQECLGSESYEAVDIIARSYEDIQKGDYTREFMAMTAIVRVFLDNQKYCKFDKMAMDVATYCFVNQCDWYTLTGNLILNWAEAVYAINMIWTTIASSFSEDTNPQNCYKFYYILGQNVSLLWADLINFKSKSDYDWEVDYDTEFAEQ